MITNNKKQRHGCLTAYLIFLLIGTISVTIENFWDVLTVGELSMYFMVLVGTFSIYSIIVMLKWQKWGFWGYCTSIVILGIIGLSFSPEELSWFLLIPLLQLAILFGVFQIGKENKGWPQLE